MNNIMLNSKIINISSDDLGSQITFSESDNDDSNYLLFQRFYGDYEEEDDYVSCYIESNIKNVTGHYSKVVKNLSEKSLEIKTEKYCINITFEIPELKYKKLKKVLNYIII
jgi:hypothetical protein